MPVTRDSQQAAAATIACILPLAVAQFAERAMGMLPCAFCLLERWPYYAGTIIGVIALLMPRRATRPLLWLIIALLAAAAALHFVHVGVQMHWWPDPIPECRAPDFTGLSMSQRLAAMPLRPAKLCEDPDYLIPGLPISFPEMGVLYALAVLAWLATWLSRTRGRKFR